jgi:DNA processing protein
VKAARPSSPSPLGMNDTERRALLALAGVDFLRPREKLVLIEMMGGADRLLSVTVKELAALVGRTVQSTLWDRAALLCAAERTAEVLTADAIDTIFYGDPAYPPRLRHIYDPPVTLFVRGQLPQDDMVCCGIVGTRFPTGAARRAAFRLGFQCGRAGIVVVSGLARGIDREAHEGCVAAGALSVAVLGSGIDEIYPSSSRRAAMGLLEAGGAIVSEYPPGAPAARYHFPARNRIISGLARGVVVVEAPATSGALFTAEYALDQGRDLFVHAQGISGSAGAGTRRLTEHGAPVISGADDLLKEWNMVPARPAVIQELASLEGGERAALLERAEIDGACFVRAGDIYWRT